MVEILTKDNEVIPVPTVIDGKFRVISYTHKENGGNGWRPNGVALCLTTLDYDPTEYDPYATWTVIYDEERDNWFAECGHYYRGIADAVEDYEKRRK